MSAGNLYSSIVSHTSVIFQLNLHVTILNRLRKIIGGVKKVFNIKKTSRGKWSLLGLNCGKISFGKHISPYHPGKFGIAFKFDKLGHICQVKFPFCDGINVLSSLRIAEQ